MRGGVALAGLIVAAAPVGVGAAPSQALPTIPGHCAFTTVKQVGERLEDGQTHISVANSGSAISFTDKGYQVSYDQVAAVDQSHPGDRVMICLLRLPRHCPPGDRRGIVYTATNFRTETSWTLPDAEHMCGGA